MIVNDMFDWLETLPYNWVFVDTETTGLPHKYSLGVYRKKRNRNVEINVSEQVCHKCGINKSSENFFY